MVVKCCRLIKIFGCFRSLANFSFLKTSSSSRYSEDYNDVDEHVVMNEEEDGSDSSLPSPPLPDDDNYEPDVGSDDSGGLRNIFILFSPSMIIWWCRKRRIKT